jgi:hypothetical protein
MFMGPWVAGFEILPSAKIAPLDGYGSRHTHIAVGTSTTSEEVVCQWFSINLDFHLICQSLLDTKRSGFTLEGILYRSHFGAKTDTGWKPSRRQPAL